MERSDMEMEAVRVLTQTLLNIKNYKWQSTLIANQHSTNVGY